MGIVAGKKFRGSAFGNAAEAHSGVGVMRRFFWKAPTFKHTPNAASVLMFNRISGGSDSGDETAVKCNVDL